MAVEDFADLIPNSRYPTFRRTSDVSQNPFEISSGPEFFLFGPSWFYCRSRVFLSYTTFFLSIINTANHRIISADIGLFKSAHREISINSVWILVPFLNQPQCRELPASGISFTADFNSPHFSTHIPHLTRECNFPIDLFLSYRGINGIIASTLRFCRPL